MKPKMTWGEAARFALRSLVVFIIAYGLIIWWLGPLSPGEFIRRWLTVSLIFFALSVLANRYLGRPRHLRPPQDK